MAEYNGVRIEPLSDGGQDLNYQVESEGKKPEDVAREYLQEKGLLEAR